MRYAQICGLLATGFLAIAWLIDGDQARASIWGAAFFIIMSLPGKVGA